jgi:hypothetical protein
MVSISITPGISGMSGEVSLEHGALLGHNGFGGNAPFLRRKLDDPIKKLEIFEPHGSRSCLELHRMFRCPAVACSITPRHEQRAGNQFPAKNPALQQETPGSWKVSSG